AVQTTLAKGNSFENKIFRLRLMPRTPNQIAAFYEARGFPDFAINELRNVCFITLGLGNRSDNKLYHDLSQWQFTDDNGPVNRILRPDWEKRWNKLGLKQRFQSTFRWTLMPEKLDFYPQEGEGGNIIFARSSQPITIKARVRTGELDKQVIYEVIFKDVECAEDPR
ncbi:MAG: hypothetical protein PVG75_12140, partial [Thioalkalispiraceae bacterium]